MGETENNSSALGLIKNLKDDVTKNKKNCQSEAIDLFKKILKAIDAHTDTQRVNKGLDDLAVEVCDLETKLSIIANERDNLLDTVRDLRAENRQLSAKLLLTMQPSPIYPLSNQKSKHSQCNQEDKSLDNGSPHATGLGINRPRIRKRGGDHRKHAEHIENTINESECDEENIISSEDESDRGVQQQIQNSLYDSDDDYDCNEVEVDVDIKEIEHVASDENVSLTNNLTHAHIGEGDANGKNNVNAAQKFNLEIEKQPANKKANKKFNCEQCPYSASRKDRMRIHIEAVHQKIMNFRCSQCPYSAAQKAHMKNHVEAVHDKIMNYRCEECNYGTSRKDRLERHVDARHNMGDKKFKCGKCPYSSAQKNNLTKHIERVHETISTMPLKGEEILPH